MWSTWNAHRVMMEIQDSPAVLGKGMAAFYNLNIQVPYDQAHVLPGIHPIK